MKNITATFTIFLLSINGFISCNSQGSTGPYILKIRMKPGDKFKQDMDIKMNVSASNSNTIMGMQESANFEVMVGDTINKWLKITYIKLLAQVDKDMPGQDEMDSVNKQFNNRLHGKSVIVKLGAGNKITEVTGLNKKFPDSLSGPGNEDIKALFDKEELNNTFGMMLNLYPEKPVQKGESWNTITTMGISGINMLADRKYTLQNVEDGIATITFDGKLTNAVMKENGLPVSMTLSGTHSGTIQINLEDGYMRKADFRMDAKGDEEDKMTGRKTPIIIRIEGNLKGN